MAEPRSPVSASVPHIPMVLPTPEGSTLEMDPMEYTLRKRLPRKLPKRRNDVYVNMKTDFKAQLARCQKLWTLIGNLHPRSGTGYQPGH